MRKLLVIVLVLCACKANAHGTGFRYSALKSIPLEFTYSDGEKMSFREAKVFSPLDEKFAFQSGRTDEDGRFAFVPNVSGDWKVIVRDEEGHRCEAVIPVTLEAQTQPISDTTKPDMTIRALLGVSIIFNIAMVIYRRKQNAHQ